MLAAAKQYENISKIKRKYSPVDTEILFQVNANIDVLELKYLLTISATICNKYNGLLIYQPSFNKKQNPGCNNLNILHQILSCMTMS